MIEYCKMQIACLVILCYTGYKLIDDGTNNRCNIFYDTLFVLAEISIFFDGFTAYTVNHLGSISLWINLGAHLLFFLSLDAVVYFLFLYIVSITFGFPKKPLLQSLFFIPPVLVFLGVTVFINKIKFIEGKITNYSMGISVYVCFIFAALFCFSCIVIFLMNYHHLSVSKRKGIIVCILTVGIIALIQLLYPESLTTSLAVTLSVIAVYLNIENPTKKENLILEEKNELERKFYNRLDELEKNQSIYRHDAKHYLSVLLTLCGENKTDEMKAILEQMNNDIIKFTPKIYTDNRIFNALINDKEARAKYNSVKLDLNIEPHVYLGFIKDIDLIAMFGNLIDNAVRAEKGTSLEEKIVKVSLYEAEGNFIIFNVENHFENPVVRLGDRFLSTKNEIGEHGLGIESVKNLVEKYNGFLDLDIDEKNKIWISSLCITKVS